MSGTISANITSSYTLTVNPTTITATGSVSVASATAILGPAGTAWTLGNAGTVVASGAQTRGVVLNSGGAISNAASASIAGGYDGVDINGAAGSLNNAGAIAGLTNNAAYLGAGGSVTNQSGGTVSGNTNGVVVSNGNRSVINNGLITASSGIGVNLQTGATGIAYIDNSGSVIGGHGGVGLGSTSAASASTLVNTGLIQGTAGNGAYLGAAASLTNAATGRISGNGAGGYGVYIGGAATVLNQGSITSANYTGLALKAGGSLTNASGGVIAANTAVSTGQGVVLSADGAVTNAPSGVISGYIAVSARYGGSIGNSGTILGGTTGSYGAGVVFGHGGTLDNVASGTIAAGGGVVGRNQPVTLINDGTIQGNIGDAITLDQGGVVQNGARGVIGGNAHGVVILHQAGTVQNAGTITASSPTGEAVYLGAGSANRLIVAGQAAFVGEVNGGNSAGSTAVSTLELASGAGTGTLTGIGSQIINFGSIAFDAGAQWLLAGSGIGFASGETISGFAQGDTIQLTGLDETIQSYAGGTLTLGGNQTLTLDLPGTFAAGDLLATQVTAGTDITVSCFAAGTRLQAVRGKVRVERLRVGDRVVTASGTLRPIRWIGHRTIECARHPRPRDVWPVRIMAGAFGPATPETDLLLSPDHAVWVCDVLIPVKYLINDTTIAQIRVPRVRYYHVELDRHDLVLVEGLAAESYLDTGDRANFSNGGQAVRLFPNFADDARAVSLAWEALGCARLVVTGVELDAARAQIAARRHALLRAGNDQRRTG